MKPDDTKKNAYEDGKKDMRYHLVASSLATIVVLTAIYVGLQNGNEGASVGLILLFLAHLIVLVWNLALALEIETGGES